MRGRKRITTIIHLALILSGPYLFCYMADLRLPTSTLEAASDLMYMYLPLAFLVPYFLVTIPLLKLFFYGSIRTNGLKIRVSNKTKRVVTYLFIATTLLMMTFFQAELFISWTGREVSPEFRGKLLNAVLLLIIGAPGFLSSLQNARKKIAAVEKLRNQVSS